MTGRRMGPPDASIRFKLLDASERVIARDGYPAVTSRSVGAEAGVDQKLVYYYFRNMEELVVATFQRRSETFLARLAELAVAQSPVKTFWELSSHRSGRLMIEFMAMATHTPTLREEVARYSEEATGIVETMLANHLSNARPESATFSPAFTSFLVASLARNFILESELKLLRNPHEIEQSIEALLDVLCR
ncbi:TetR/AcrR family transcriptional regulator [Novosphingobium sp. G106]|uniref:TetR/AcrR family transcriptional regulator n=1 Tax=Novosphingobium sp. G106 TaxID=2849500 RepID=UPI001C2CF8EF|nr:TetR family transcriptional regulator [Novosphingobium sp. G106]MBV1688406.1 TetR/AcrR family transcriptional regulator [Novosphingobium sp. G106]